MKYHTLGLEDGNGMEDVLFDCIIKAYQEMLVHSRGNEACH